MKSYWLDSSCEGGLFKPKFEPYILEARILAHRALQRLQSPTDTDFARVFNVIFKTPKTSTTEFPLPDLFLKLNGMGKLDPNQRPKKSIPALVMETLEDFASGWERTKNREQADVRLYNNCAARLVREKHLTNAAGAVIWKDPINWIKTAGDLEQARKDTNAITMHTHDGNTGDKGTENPRRATIDILPTAWKSERTGLPNSMRALKGTIAKDAIPLYPIQIDFDKYVGGMMTLTVAHEFMHVHAYGFTDGLSTYEPDLVTAGWSYIMRQTKDMAYEHAEAIALLIMAAGLADVRPHGAKEGGFTLDRSWDTIPGQKDPVVTNLKWDGRHPKNTAARGMFKYYSDLTE
ncbi:hypothetical protein V8F20_009212 [Naviculisporaceae sp. PSN 640]